MSPAGGPSSELLHSATSRPLATIAHPSVRRSRTCSLPLRDLATSRSITSVPSRLIAIASLGATRTLVFRSKDRARVVEVPLGHGSVLLMNEATQHEWQHAVKREPDAGLRVSVTFRQICRPESARP